MRLEDLPLNIPVLITTYYPSIPCEVIRLSDNILVSRPIVSNSWLSYSKNHVIRWEDLRLLDTPTDEDAAKCGNPPYQCTEAWLPPDDGLFGVNRCGNVLSVIGVNNCTCDFVTQILPYGCKCGGK